MDSRGFYEHLFDDIGDYYPTWRRSSKEYPEGNNVDTEDAPPHASVLRSKRNVENSSLRNEESTTNSSTKNVEKETVLKQKENHTVDKRSPSRHARGMEMGSSGFHEDTFNSAFGDFITMRRRRIARTLQKERIDDLLNKLSSEGIKIGEKKVSQEVLDGLKHPESVSHRLEDKDNDEDLPIMMHGLNNFLRHGLKMGYFTDHPLGKYKRRPEMDSSGFHGDMFGGSFGDFDTMKKKAKTYKTGNQDYNMYAEPYTSNWLFKRRPEMDSAGFHGDTFGGSFGDFDTMKKRRPEMDSAGFHGDMFGGSFGEFDTMKKRRPEMDSSGFHGDMFGGSFGDFDTMKKRRPEMDSAGFHGDMFGGSFGEFDTMKKRRPEMDSAGFHGDMFGGSFGEFDTMKKRRPEMDSAGFHGDMFGGSFGDFDTMKKRRPEMDSSGFHGDMFGGSFGDFDTMRKRLATDSDVMKRSTKRPSEAPVAEDNPSERCDCQAIAKLIGKNDNKKYRFDKKCLLNCPKKL